MSNHGNEQSKSMIEIFIRQSAEKEDKLFLADEEKAYTYGQALQEVKSYVYKLEELGLKTKDRLVVECSQDAKFVLILPGSACGVVVYVQKYVRWICSGTKDLYRGRKKYRCDRNQTFVGCLYSSNNILYCLRNQGELGKGLERFNQCRNDFWYCILPGNRFVY